MTESNIIDFKIELERVPDYWVDLAAFAVLASAVLFTAGIVLNYELFFWISLWMVLATICHIIAMGWHYRGCVRFEKE